MLLVEGVAIGEAFSFRRPSSLSLHRIGGMEGYKETAATVPLQKLCFGILLEEKQTCDLLTLNVLSLLG